MLPLVYESDPLQYELHEGPPTGYNTFLRVPPRLYDETLDRAHAIFVMDEPSRYSQAVLCVLCIWARNDSPGWGVAVEKFDLRSGDFVGRVDLASTLDTIGVTTARANAGRSGELWYQRTDEIRRVSTTTWENVGDIASGDVIDVYAYDPIISGVWCVDRLANRILSSSTGGYVNVFNLTSHALLGTVDVGGTVRGIFLEGPSRCYVVLDGGIYVLVDYILLSVLGVFRIEDEPTASYTQWTYDPSGRRILRFDQTEDNEDGSSTSITRGWFPRPIAVGMSPSIPLRVPRRGRVVPFAVRAYGDAGESAAGAEVTIVATGDGSVAATRRPTDAYGYARFFLSCDDAGSVTLDASMETEA